VNQFGDTIKNLREKQGLLQRQVATHLEIDTPMLSKIERGERSAKREQVIILADLFKQSVNDLLSLWLADKVYDIIKDEEVGLKAIQVAEEQVKYQSKKKKK
jgi:transcriptional regulator with XRE-family HTH domain